MCLGNGSEVRGMGRGVVWDPRVINPTLSLTSSRCRNNLVSRDSSSLVESPHGFPRLSACSMMRTPPSGGGFPSSGASPLSPPPHLSSQISGGVSVITSRHYRDRSPSPQIRRLSLLGAGIGPFKSGRIHQLIHTFPVQPPLLPPT